MINHQVWNLAYLEGAIVSFQVSESANRLIMAWLLPSDQEVSKHVCNIWLWHDKVHLPAIRYQYCWVYDTIVCDHINNEEFIYVFIEFILPLHIQNFGNKKNERTLDIERVWYALHMLQFWCSIMVG